MISDAPSMTHVAERDQEDMYLGSDDLFGPDLTEEGLEPGSNDIVLEVRQIDLSSRSIGETDSKDRRPVRIGTVFFDRDTMIRVVCRQVSTIDDGPIGKYPLELSSDDLVFGRSRPALLPSVLLTDFFAVLV